MVKKNNDEVRQRVMEKISKDEIKMKARWRFMARFYGAKSLTVIALTGSALLLTYAVYVVEINSPPELFTYGQAGREIFLRDFPYLLLLATLTLGAGGALLYSKIGDHYKKRTKSILLMVSVGLLIITGLLTAARILFHLDQYLGF